MIDTTTIFAMALAFVACVGSLSFVMLYQIFSKMQDMEMDLHKIYTQLCRITNFQGWGEDDD